MVTRGLDKGGCFIKVPGSEVRRAYGWWVVAFNPSVSFQVHITGWGDLFLFSFWLYYPILSSWSFWGHSYVFGGITKNRCRIDRESRDTSPTVSRSSYSSPNQTFKAENHII